MSTSDPAVSGARNITLPDRRLSKPIYILDLPDEVMNIASMHIHVHKTGSYCYYCGCQECRYFYGMGIPNRCVDPRIVELTPPPPPYSYMILVNKMRTAAAKREERRDEKKLVQRLGTASTGSLKKEKAPKDTPKRRSLRQIMKRRRQ